MPKEIVAPHVAQDVAGTRRDRRERRVEPHRHVAAGDVEADTGNADLALVGDHPADRLGIAEVAVGADHAGDRVAHAHAGAHLRQRRLAVLAEDGERRVAVGSFLRRQFERGRLRGEMFVARRLAELAPGRHAASARFLARTGDAAVGIEAGRQGQFAGTGFVGIGATHGRPPVSSKCGETLRRPSRSRRRRSFSPAG